MTTREAIYGELGWWTLQARRDFKKIMYLFQISSLSENDLRKKVYTVTKRTGKKSSFARYMKEVLDTYALGYLYDDEKKFFNWAIVVTSKQKLFLHIKSLWRDGFGQGSMNSKNTSGGVKLHRVVT
jgi:hypothetical protein